jgi:hypothetical protein
VTPEITFHRSEDLILGVCGLQGFDGIYRLFLGSGRDWEFCPNGTKAWDWYHQLVFLKRGAKPCDPWALGDSVPPIPESFPPPERYIVRDPAEPEAPHAKQGSSVFERVAAAPRGCLRVYVVLYEDLYETRFGDGTFRDFSAAFFDEEAAQAYITSKAQAASPESRKLMEFHVRTVGLEIRGDVLALDEGDSGLSSFDHFTQRQVTDSLAESLGG